LKPDREDSYGQWPGEIDVILGYYEVLQDSAKAVGAIVIDARKPVNEIADLIIAETVSI